MEIIIEPRLRQLRLWHWRQAMRYRELEREMRDLAAAGHSHVSSYIKKYSKMAGDHLYHVQTLNDFFPIGDTAEQDESNEDAERSRTT